jgi:branched-subunit amino acid ABC-type transport system permease component
MVATIVGTATGEQFWLALALAPLSVAALGILVEVAVMRRAYRQGHLVQLLATYGVLLILADVALHLWGTTPRSVSGPAILAGSVSFPGGAFPEYDLFVIGAAVVVGLALWALLARTAFGWRIRGAVQDVELLSAQGTNVRVLFSVVFGLGALLAGIGGALITPIQGVAPGMDQSILVSAFIVAVIGGLGSTAGAALGALIIALFEAAGTLWVPSWAPAFLYLAMIVVLAVRPTGLLGVRER